MVKFKGQPLGTYYKMQRKHYKKRLMISIGVLIASIFFYSLGLFLTSIELMLFALFIIGITFFVVIILIISTLFSRDMYLEIYEEGFKFTAKNNIEYYSWDDVQSCTITRKGFFDGVRPQSVPAFIFVAILGFLDFSIPAKDTDSILLTFKMKNGAILSFNNFQGDDFSELAYQILPQLIKNKLII